jgi:hypothetical protein
MANCSDVKSLQEWATLQINAISQLCLPEMTLELKPKDEVPSAMDKIKQMLQGLKDTTQSVQAACLQQIMGLSMKRQTLVKMQSEVSKADLA